MVVSVEQAKGEEWI